MHFTPPVLTLLSIVVSTASPLPVEEGSGSSEAPAPVVQAQEEPEEDTFMDIPVWEFALAIGAGSLSLLLFGYAAWVFCRTRQDERHLQDVETGKKVVPTNAGKVAEAKAPKDAKKIAPPKDAAKKDAAKAAIANAKAISAKAPPAKATSAKAASANAAAAKKAPPPAKAQPPKSVPVLIKGNGPVAPGSIDLEDNKQPNNYWLMGYLRKNPARRHNTSTNVQYGVQKKKLSELRKMKSAI